MPTTTSAYEHLTLPDEDYRAALVSLLSLQAVPVWSVGQQPAYEAFVMDGASLEHWVRISGMWAEIERNVWELGTLLVHLGIPSVDALLDERTAGWRRLVESSAAGWIDLLFLEIIIDGLGAGMVQAGLESSYAPLTRMTRLLSYGKAGAVASGIVGLREVLTAEQAPRSLVEERLAVWTDVGTTLVAQLDEAQHGASWLELGIASRFDASTAFSESRDRITKLLEARP